MEVNGVHLCTTNEITGAFNNHFSSVGKCYTMAIKKSNQEIAIYLSKLTKNMKSIYFHPTTKQEINDLIMNLPNKKSSGYDELDNLLLKKLVTELEEPLCILFNRSLSCGVFPTSMILAEVVPLYKSKEKFLCNNYRPISLLITISKVLEKLVYKRTYSFLNNRKQIYDSQYGFRSKHSCEHAIQELVGKVLKGQELGKSTLAVFLYLSKAFDTISHSVLFKKLELYGIRGICLDWFKSYLSGRQM